MVGGAAILPLMVSRPDFAVESDPFPVPVSAWIGVVLGTVRNMGGAVFKWQALFGSIVLLPTLIFLGYASLEPPRRRIVWRTTAVTS